MTLADLELAQEAVIQDFENNSQAIKRLLSFGIEPGSIVKLEFQTFQKGTICISNKNRMIALDAAEASKITVTPNP
ncbi:MAG: ferrous iron transport protein A [Bacteroidia bacterium]|nr:ferrous iron transport protein A [Bacteroidia bacterium]